MTTCESKTLGIINEAFNCDGLTHDAIASDVVEQMDFLTIQENHFPMLFKFPFRYFSNYFHSALQLYSKVNHY